MELTMYIFIIFFFLNICEYHLQINYCTLVVDQYLSYDAMYALLHCFDTLFSGEDAYKRPCPFFPCMFFCVSQYQ